jgi:hypothetical protein
VFHYCCWCLAFFQPSRWASMYASATALNDRPLATCRAVCWARLASRGSFPSCSSRRTSSAFRKANQFFETEAHRVGFPLPHVAEDPGPILGRADLKIQVAAVAIGARLDKRPHFYRVEFDAHTFSLAGASSGREAAFQPAYNLKAVTHERR